ncbi:MAG: type II toxin-antitoxin system VapC family toxin [Candidatus Sulfotelmatobacter sp.]
MKVLLDTHTFLWALGDPDRLSTRAREAIASSERFWSVASIWEALLKVQSGKLPMPLPAGSYLTSKMSANGMSLLPIRVEHVLRVEELPMHHRDPFDRMLIAQCMEENWPIITSDPVFKKYQIRVIW